MAVYRQYYVDFGKGLPGWFVEITALDGRGREIELWDGAAWPTPDSLQCASAEWRAVTRGERAEILAALERAPAPAGRAAARRGAGAGSGQRPGASEAGRRCAGAGAEPRTARVGTREGGQDDQARRRDRPRAGAPPQGARVRRGAAAAAHARRPACG